MVEKRTVGGRPIEEVFQKLKEDIPNVIRYTNDDDRNPYLESNAMRKHFDSIVPLQNYEFFVTEPKLVSVGGRSCFICVGTLTMYDDEGKKVISKSYVGGENCIIVKDTGNAKNLSLDVKNVAVAARKECMRLFGCGELQLERAKEEKKAERTGKKSEQKNGNYRNSVKNSNSYDAARSKNNAQPSAPFGQQRAATSNNTSAPQNQPTQQKTATGNLASDQQNQPAQQRAVSNNSATATQSRSVQNGNRNTAASGGTAKVPPVGKGNFRLVRDKSQEITENGSQLYIPVICRDYSNYRTKLLIWKNSKTNAQRQNILNRVETGIEFECLGKFEMFMDKYRIVYENMEV